MDNRTKEIIIQVAYKGMVERCKGWRNIFKRQVPTEEEIRHDTLMLIKLVEEFTPNLATESGKMYLHTLLERSIYDENQQQGIASHINDTMTMNEYFEIKTGLLNNQGEPNNPNQTDIGNQIDEKLNQQNA